MDIRIVKTHNKLNDSFFQILKKKKINDISVLELCKKAKINRTTFYKYFESIDDYVIKIEKDIEEELKTSISQITRNYLISFINILISKTAENDTKYVMLFSENGDSHFLKHLLFLVYEESINEWKRLLKKAKDEDLQRIYDFIVEGSIGIIKAWIKSKSFDEKDNISVFINKICMSGLSSFI